MIENGHSLIMERIEAEKKAGGCNCFEKNPNVDALMMFAGW